MKKRDFFEQLEAELNSLPALREDVLAAPFGEVVSEKKPLAFELIENAPRDDRTEKTEKTERTEREERRAERRERSVFSRKKTGWMATGAVAAAALIVCVAALAPHSGNGGTGGGASPITYTYAEISINPSVTLVLDENMKVKKVLSMNADGDTLIAESAFVSTLVGANLQTAAIKLAESAAQNGFFDFEKTGEGADYNEISLTVTTNGETDGVLEETKSGLIEYFCEKGLYVYVNTGAIKAAENELKNTVNEYMVRTEQFIESVQSDVAAFENTIKAQFFEYAQDLLEDSIKKHELFAKAEATNAAIKADEGNFFGLDYWLVNPELNENVAVLCDQMDGCLQELNALFGIESSLESYVSAQLAHSMIVEMVDIEAMYALKDQGVSEKLFKQDKALLNGYLTFVADELFSDLFTAFLEGTDSITAFAETLQGFVNGRAQVLKEYYTARLSAVSDGVDEAEYAAFLERIGKSK